MSIEETDPTGRYVRYKKVLGKGAYKTVYSGFDTVEALEVAWNKLELSKLSDLEVSKVSQEVNFLKTVKHNNIIACFASWNSADEEGKTSMDFITELMISGTLKDYIAKAPAIKLKVIRRWGFNILQAIHYLHSNNPPIMHRDLKCDNIFINGHVGEVKIGDLGLSSFKEQEKAFTVIGTPEFMAPELYDESYTELVDVYAFGMCLLEMITMEYPYSECSNPAQIFKKVFSGEKPEALKKLKDCVFKDVITQCLQREENRPSAKNLVEHPLFCDWESDDGKLSNLSLLSDGGHGDTSDLSAYSGHHVFHAEAMGRDVVVIKEDEKKLPIPSLGTHIQGVIVPKEVRIAVNIPVKGTFKRIEFPFDPSADSPEELAKEMVSEFNLDIAQQASIEEQIKENVEAAVLVAKADELRIRESTAGIEQVHEKVKPLSNVGSPENRLAPIVVVGSREAGAASPARSRVSGMSSHSAGGHSAGGHSGVHDVHSGVYSSQGRSGIRKTQGTFNAKYFGLCMSLMDHVAKGRAAQVKQKLEQGASASYADYDKRTPLHLAAEEGHAEVAEILIQYGADIEASDRWGSTPLDTAISNKHNNVIHVLEKYGAIRDDIEDDGMSPEELSSIELLEFSARGLIDLVKEKLMSGASASYADYDKRTPLHLAAAEGHARIVELLLVNGAQLDFKDRFGRTAVDDAMRNGHKNVLLVMKQYGADIPSHILAADTTQEFALGIDLIEQASKGRSDAVEALLKKGASAQFGDYDKRTPLHLACAEGHVKVVEILLSHGGDIDAKDRWGETPRDEAMKNNHEAILKLIDKSS